MNIKNSAKTLVSLLLSIVLANSAGVVASAVTPSCTLLPARSVVQGGEVFLGGDFIELGLSAVGSWGTAGDVPAGIRGNDTRDNLGMGADLDGYCATASDNTDLPIDFFTPGGQEERWGVSFTLSGAEHYGSYSEKEGDSSSLGVTATHTVTNESAGEVLSAKVVSIISLDSAAILSVSVTHTFAKSNAYFLTSVVFENVSGSALSDVRYHRSFDPDNAKFQGGDYTTRQTILDTVTDGGTSVVQAKLQDSDLTALAATGILKQLLDTSGITTEIPILFYSDELESVAYFGGFTNPNPYNPYGGGDPFGSPQAKDSTVEDDGAMGIIVRTLSLASGASEDPLKYVTSLDSRDFSEISSELAEEADGGSEIAAPAPYTGPLLQDFSSRTLDVCTPKSITITGVRLSDVTASVQGESVTVLENTATKLVLAFPAGLTPGQDVDLVINSSSGTLTHQDAFDIPADTCAADLSKGRWTQLQSDGKTVKMYAKDPIGDGKIQFFVDGEEIAWVNAIDEADPKLSFASSNPYLVRSVALKPGKNRFDIKLDGVRVWRATYVPKG